MGPKFTVMASVNLNINSDDDDDADIVLIEAVVETVEVLDTEDSSQNSTTSTILYSSNSSSSSRSTATTASADDLSTGVTTTSADDSSTGVTTRSATRNKRSLSSSGDADEGQEPAQKRVKMVKQKDDAANECAICFRSIRSVGRHKVRRLSCGHEFGNSCVTTWFKHLTKKNKRKTCPICRAQTL